MKKSTTCPITGGGGIDLVREPFGEEDMSLILTLTVHEERDNVLIWHYDQREIFLVEFCYGVCGITQRYLEELNIEFCYSVFEVHEGT
jgi:hypothetical protein